MWRRTSSRADKWDRLLGASGYLVRMIRYVIYDRPCVPFTGGQVLSDIPQTQEEIEFAEEDLKYGLASGVYERVSRVYVHMRKTERYMVSNALVSWNSEGADRKARFVINLAGRAIIGPIAV